MCDSHGDVVVTLSLPHRGALVGVAGAGACVFAGLAAVQRGSFALVLLLALCAVAMALIFGEIGFGAVLIWIGLSGPLYPFLSIGATGLPISFDRVVIAGFGT